MEAAEEDRGDFICLVLAKDHLTFSQNNGKMPCNLLRQLIYWAFLGLLICYHCHS